MTEIRIYSAESGVSNPIKLLREIFKGFKEGHFLAYQLFIRDLKASVRQSFLGFFWHFVPAIATAVIWILLNSQKVISIGDLPMKYPAFAITGTIVWSLFTEGVNKLSGRFNSSKGMMVKLNFPKEAIILAAFYDLMFSLMLKLIVLIPSLVLIGYMPEWSWLLGLAGVFPLLILGISFGLLLVPIGMLYTDVKRGVALTLQVMMYLSPVIFPYQTKGIMGVIHKWNPVSPYIEFIRSNFGGYEFVLGYQFILWIVASIVLFLFGLIVLKLSLPAILERSGA